MTVKHDAATASPIPSTPSRPARAAQSGKATTYRRRGTGSVEAIRALRMVSTLRDTGPHRRDQSDARLDRDRPRRSPRSISRGQHRQARQQRRSTPTGRSDHGRGCDEVRVARTRPARSVAQRRDRTRQRRPRHARHDDRTRAWSRVIGVGIDTAATLLVTAGDNPDRLRSEASFAHLCGSAPIDASSGQIVRKRLNPRGDRQANEALWRIVLVRMGNDPRTHRLRRAPHPRRQEQTRDHALPEALRRHERSTATSTRTQRSHLTDNRSFISTQVLRHVITSSIRRSGAVLARMRF